MWNTLTHSSRSGAFLTVGRLCLDVPISYIVSLRSHAFKSHFSVKKPTSHNPEGSLLCGDKDSISIGNCHMFDLTWDPWHVGYMVSNVDLCLHQFDQVRRVGEPVWTEGGVQSKQLGLHSRYLNLIGPSLVWSILSKPVWITVILFKLCLKWWYGRVKALRSISFFTWSLADPTWSVYIGTFFFC